MLVSFSQVKIYQGSSQREGSKHTCNRFHDRPRMVLEIGSNEGDGFGGLPTFMGAESTFTSNDLSIQKNN